MKPASICWIAALLLTSAHVTASPWIAIQNADGHDLMSFVAQDNPFAPGVSPRVSERRTSTASDGRAITGVAYYAWIVESRVRVIVLAELPANQAKPGAFPAASPDARYEQIAEFSLAVGESREVQELESFGCEPRTVKIVAPHY